MLRRALGALLVATCRPTSVRALNEQTVSNATTDAALQEPPLAATGESDATLPFADDVDKAIVTELDAIDEGLVPTALWQSEANATELDATSEGVASEADDEVESLDSFVRSFQDLGYAKEEEEEEEEEVEEEVTQEEEDEERVEEEAERKEGDLVEAEAADDADDVEAEASDDVAKASDDMVKLRTFVRALEGWHGNQTEEAGEEEEEEREEDEEFLRLREEDEVEEEERMAGNEAAGDEETRKAASEKEDFAEEDDEEDYADEDAQEETEVEEETEVVGSGTQSDEEDEEDDAGAEAADGTDDEASLQKMVDKAYNKAHSPAAAHKVDEEAEEAEAVRAMMEDLAQASPEDIYLAALSSEELPEPIFVGDEEETGDLKASRWAASEDFEQSYEFDETYYYTYHRHDQRTMEPPEGFSQESFVEKDKGALESAYYYQWRHFDPEAREKAAQMIEELRSSASEDSAEGAEKKRLRGSKQKEPQLEQIDLVMLSDRQVGAAASLQSVCSNSVDASRLNLHIIGPTEQGKWTLDALAPACATGRAKMHLYSLQEMTQRVEDVGYNPIWKWPANGVARSELSVHPASWDNSTTHKDPFNLLRFYLPHIAPFDKLSKLIFMDDDVIINRDVAEAWDFELRNGTIMSASCHNWIWSNCDRFRSGTEFSYLDVPYFGFGHIGLDRTVNDATCANDDQEECAPNGFMEMLRNQSVLINGPERALSLKLLRQSKAWNYGFNKFDLDAWRANNITQRFLMWMQVNHDLKIFPETSLAYGLGIAMLTKIGRVHCFPPEYDVIQGLGFVGTHDMHNAGINGTGIRRAFGFHFNGPKKPWVHASGNPFSSYFLAYSQPEVQRTFSDAAREHRAKRSEREAQNATSFVVFTDPRSGSEWFMDLLDRHPQMCASGEADDGASSFPREALIPGRYIKLGEEEEDDDEPTAEGEQSQPFLFQINKSISEEDRRRMFEMDLLAPPSERELQLLQNQTASDEDDRRKFADGSLSNCQAKAACSWGSISRHVWRVCTEGETLCTPSRLERAFHHKTGINRYLGVVCHLRANALEGMTAKDASKPRLLFSEVFKVYFRHMTRHSLSLNDASFGTFREARQILPCRCPKQAVLHGQKLMHDWMGDLPLTGWAASQWKTHPYGINYNADEASLVMDLPYVDMLGSMAEAGTKAIMFERKNLLARYVSIRTANQTAIFHCASDECVKVARQVKIFVDVPRFRNFVAWTNRRHQENRDLVAKYGIPMLELVYEECVDNSQYCLYQVCKFLNVTAPEVALHEVGKQVKVMGNLGSHIENIEEVTQALKEDNLLHYLDE